MHTSAVRAVRSWLALLAVCSGCSTVIGIDKDYTDWVASDANLAGSGGAAGRGGAPAQGAANAAGASAEGGASAQAGAAGQNSTARCDGVTSGGLCWYLGALGDGCTNTCAAHGGEAPEAASFVGTAAEGGSLGECAAILAAIGGNPTPTAAKRTDGAGFGCHRFGVLTYWLSSPAYSSTAKGDSVRRVCGCEQ